MSRCDNPLKPRAPDLRLPAADGALVPVSTRAEVLLLRPHHPLQGAHVGSRARARAEEEEGKVGVMGISEVQGGRGEVGKEGEERAGGVKYRCDLGWRFGREEVRT